MTLSNPFPSGLRADPHESAGGLGLCLHTTARSAHCPLCQQSSHRIHSRYHRTLRDLPDAEQTRRLHIRARRFFCDNPECNRRTFAERLPDFAVAHAQRTDRLKQALTTIAQAIGSRPGVRLAKRLFMPVSATTLLRQERAAPLPEHPTPRVLGVDDWAFRKGHNYGAILYDMERHVVVDLLPDRTAQTLAQWLLERPGVEIVTRDRAEAFAEGARQGAPDAQQVADRWHLVKNLGEAFAHFLETRRFLLKQAVSSPEALALPEEKSTVPASSLSPRKMQMQKEMQCRRQARQERYEEVRRLYGDGYKISPIARLTGLSGKTVLKYVQALAYPERKVRAARPTPLDAYKSRLNGLWQSGSHNGAALFQEMRSLGYTGGYTSVRDYLVTLRKQPTQPCSPAVAVERLSISEVVAWILRRRPDRTVHEQAVLDSLSSLCEPFRIAFALTQRFLEFVRLSPRTDQSEVFRAWLDEVQTSDVGEMRVFAAGLQRDQSAVEAGLSLSWSNGAVEGNVNRLKFLKRRGYGRANFDLLRRRVLGSA